MHMGFESTQHLKVKDDNIQNQGLWTINQERKVWERKLFIPNSIFFSARLKTRKWLRFNKEI